MAISDNSATAAEQQKKRPRSTGSWQCNLPTTVNLCHHLLTPPVIMDESPQWRLLICMTLYEAIYSEWAFLVSLEVYSVACKWSQRVCVCVYICARRRGVYVCSECLLGVCECTTALQDTLTWSNLHGPSVWAALALAVSDGQGEAVLPFHKVTK